MSNYLAIATVTAALQQVLLGPVTSSVSGASDRFSGCRATQDGAQCG